MSDEPTKAQRMSWNNDGMDPDWRPSHTSVETIGSKIDALISAAKTIANIPFKEEDFKSDDFVQIKMLARYFRDLKQALKDLEIQNCYRN